MQIMTMEVWVLFLTLMFITTNPVAAYDHCEKNGLTVTSKSGTYTGLINGTAPNVRQFLRIPYGKPPVGNLRWEPPQKPQANLSVRYDSTYYPPACPQFISSSPSLYNLDVPEWLVSPLAQNFTANAFSLASAEDCLYLAVWTPLRPRGRLPVAMFMTGGGFQVGGINVPYQLPYHWVERTQAHIVVTINYRMNIMGFPNARGLQDNNLGLLDQRMALEWVRDNIEAFGGDPNKITLWGQSAGSTSTELQDFAYPDDPIAQGFIMTSGTNFLALFSPADIAQTNFSYVASQLGCDGLSATAEIECMRTVSVEEIVTFISTNTRAGVRLSFSPVVDNKVVFANYTDRYIRGLFSKRPAIFSTTSRDGLAVLPYPNPNQGPNETLLESATLQFFTCPAAESAALRSRYIHTYRYQFAGNFSNVSPRFWLGAYHDADLAMIMGTHQDFRGNSTAYEFATADVMQDDILAFMRDPVRGPPRVGWQPYSSGRMLRFGAGNIPVQEISIESVDGVCNDTSI